MNQEKKRATDKLYLVSEDGSEVASASKRECEFPIPDISRTAFDDHPKLPASDPFAWVRVRLRSEPRRADRNPDS